MSYAEKIIKGSAIVFLAAIAAAIIGYLLRLFLARSLSIEEFGLLYSILAFVGIFSIFKDLGLGNTLVKFLAEFSGNGQKENIKPSIFLVGVIQTAAALALMLPIIIYSDFIAVSYFKFPAASLPLRLIAASFLAGTIMTTLQQAAQGLGIIKLYSVTEPMRITVTFAASFALIYMGVAGVSYAYLIAAIVAAAALFFWLNASGMITGKLEFSGKLARKFMVFGLPVFIGGLSSLLLLYTDTITLTIFRGVADVGLYQAVLPTSQLLWVLVSSLTVTLLPAVSEMWSKKQASYASIAVSLLSKFTLIVVIPLSGIMIAFSEDIILLLFGQTYLPAAAALQILAVNSIFYSIFLIFSVSLISTGMPLANTKITAFISALNLVLDVLLVPAFGITAAAAATTASYIIGSLLAYMALRKHLTLSIDVKSIAKAFIAGALSLAIIFSLKTGLAINPVMEAALSLVAGLAFYAIFMLRTGCLKKDEIKTLERLNIPIPAAVKRAVAKIAS